ncbi:LamG-like jellyroll fold domain-containing protein [Myxococcus sp. AM011]|uniref:LamG-like jellyroll fold domain-containing protein n=1 Tax=Myxococcus sp. AM011 TaxID=2745200 RepID=UPI0020CFABC9|nr:LamG-like jellyroll fold domain-containing protein [Myxococcus sp. AM011]
MRSRPGVLWSWGLGMTMALSLGACGVESLGEKVRPPEIGVSQEDDGALTSERPEASLTWDPYADAVASGTTATVLNASAALGAPDGQAATLLGLLNAALVLDLGQGEEGTGDLRVYYQGLSLALVAQVDFLKADGTFIGSSSLHLVELGLGTHIAVATYPGNVPYRYVRLRGAVALYLVDAVETSLRPVCGDGVLGGFEICDDGNQLSGDGCNSVCQVEPGYTCTGQPSICTDIDECTNGTANCQPGEICVNTPGSYTCEPDLCVGVVCAPLDACHIAGTCNPSTGQCSHPVAPDGTACDDGNACTQPDTCLDGVCAGPPSADPTSGLAHRWTFDEASGSTALDSAGASNGTLGSSSSRTVSFDGSGAVTLSPTQRCDLNAHVDFGLAPGQFGTGDFTVSYWLQTTFNSAGTGDLIGNRVAGSAGNFLGARLNGGSSLASLEMYENAAGANGAGVNVSPSPLNNGSWHHVVYTRGGTSLKVYIDGVLVGSSTSAAPTNLTGANSFRIGRRLPTCPSTFFSIPASFDDVRIYSRELTACDVAAVNTP